MLVFFLLPLFLCDPSSCAQSLWDYFSLSLSIYSLHLCRSTVHSFYSICQGSIFIPEVKISVWHQDFLDFIYLIYNAEVHILQINIAWYKIWISAAVALQIKSAEMLCCLTRSSICLLWVLSPWEVCLHTDIACSKICLFSGSYDSGFSLLNFLFWTVFSVISPIPQWKFCFNGVPVTDLKKLSYRVYLSIFIYFFFCQIS